MSEESDEDELVRTAALRNAQSVFIARQRAERDLLEAKEALERKTEELEQQREWFQVALSSIGDAVITTDTDGNVTFVNPVAEKLTGWKSPDARGHALETVLRIIHEQTRQPAQNPVTEVLRDRTIVGFANHMILISRDGAEIPIEDSAAPILDNEGKILGIILVFRDVGNKREIETRLRESEQRFRFLDTLGKATRSLSDPKQIIAIVEQLLCEHLAVSRVTYSEVGADGDRFRTLDDCTRGCESTIGDYKLSDFGPTLADEMRAGRTLIVNNVDADLVDDPGVAAFNAIEVKAIACCPLKRREALSAMMAVHQTTPRPWTQAEISLIQKVVDRYWAVIERARAEMEVREWARLSTLRAEIAAQLASGDDLDQSLQTCCELLVRHLGVAFARVWTVLPDEAMLSLRASAGLYTHLDGPHSRVPIGEFKIGRIARERKALLTNSVSDDPNISDPEWARRERMVGFAGYPLLAEERTVGVLAMFSRQTFSATTLDDLVPIADSVAQCVERKRAELELRLATERAERSALAVTESAERFRLLSEIVSIQVWTAREDGRLDYVNHECAQYFGTDSIERDILGNAWAQYVHPEDLPAALQS